MKQNVSAPIIVGMLVVELAMVGWLFWKYVFAPVQSTMLPYSPELARKYGQIHAQSAKEARYWQMKRLREAQKNKR